MNNVISLFIITATLFVASPAVGATELPGLGDAFNIARWVEGNTVEAQITKLKIQPPKSIWSCNHVKYRVEEASELLYETNDFVKALDVLNLQITTEQMMATGKSFYKNALATSQNLFQDPIVELNVLLNPIKSYAMLNSPFSFDVASQEVGTERVSYIKTANEIKVRLNYLDICLESKVHIINLPCLDLMDPVCRNANILKVNTSDLKTHWIQHFEDRSQL